jgi:hypothetical protein
MCFFFSFIPATIFAVIGYFLLASAGHAEGSLQTLGKVLGIWLFVLAMLPLAGGAYMTLSGKCAMGSHMGGCMDRGARHSMMLPDGAD